MNQQQREEAIRTQAYLLWEEAGRPDGLSLQFWADAEQLYDRPRELGYLEGVANRLLDRLLDVQPLMSMSGSNLFYEIVFDVLVEPLAPVVKEIPRSRRKVDWNKYGF